MKVTILLFVAFAMTFVVSFSARAGEDCDTACEAYLKAAGDAPYSGDLAPTTEAMYCLHVLDSRPTPLVLRDGLGISGKPLLRWRVQHWQATFRGFEREVCIPARLLAGKSEVSLCGRAGHSKWRPHHLAELRKVKRIPQANAACVGGKEWCAQRGL